MIPDPKIQINTNVNVFNLQFEAQKKRLPQTQFTIMRAWQTR